MGASRFKNRSQRENYDYFYNVYLCSSLMSVMSYGLHLKSHMYQINEPSQKNFSNVRLPNFKKIIIYFKQVIVDFNSELKLDFSLHVVETFL